MTTIVPHPWNDFPAECVIYLTVMGLVHLAILIVGCIVLATLAIRQRGTFLTPDGAYRVEMVEYARRLDRNFYLRLQRTVDGTSTNIFHSPDEGRPIGTERIIWSRDSSRFLLLGKHFVVEPMAQLTNGEAVYLLYDVRSGLLRCNAAQQRTFTNIPPAELQDIQWTNHF